MCSCRPALKGYFDVVVIVASLGGLHAVSTVLHGLPENFPTPIVVVQHGRGSDDRDRLARLLRGITPVPVRTATAEAERLSRGATVVPGGFHATLDETGRLALTVDASLSGGDALMSSAARAFGPRVIGVVLTGMLVDGTRGVLAIKGHGGRNLAQEPATARAGSMPSHAIASGCVDFVLPLERIPSALIALTMAPGGAELLTVPTPAWVNLPH